MKTTSLRSVAVGLALFVAAAASHAAPLEARVTTSALVPVSGASPFVDCTSDAVALQMGIDFPNSAVEPFLTINPTDPNNLVGSWQQDRWSTGGARGVVAGVSYDAGKSWAIIPIPGVTVCTGGSFLRASDPWLSFGPTGDLYCASLVFHTDNTPAGLAHRGVLVSKSTDGGTTWSTPIAVDDFTDPQAIDDKESITADPTDATLVYVVWDRVRTADAEDLVFGDPASSLTSDDLALPRAAALGSGSAAPVYFARSLNGGHTWEAARSIFDPGAGTQTIGNQIVVQPDGTLLDAFTGIQTVGGSTIYAASLIRSTDHGATWEPWGDGVPMRPRVLFSPTGMGVYDPSSGHALRTGDVLAEVTVNGANGDLYLVWEDARFSDHGQFSDPAKLIDEIAFSMSTDGGASWSAPIKVNQTPTELPLGNRQAFTPTVRVAADGTIAVTYYDFRFDDASADLKTDYFAAECHPSAAVSCADAANWRSEVRLTEASFDMRRAPDAGGFFVGDYQGLAADGESFLAFFSQTVPAGFASTFVRRFGPAATATPSPTFGPSPSGTPLRESCVGDCNTDGLVTVDELVIGIDIALGTLPVSACASVELGGNGTVTVDALIRAVNNALDGCSR